MTCECRSGFMHLSLSDNTFQEPCLHFTSVICLIIGIFFTLWVLLLNRCIIIIIRRRRRRVLCGQQCTVSSMEALVFQTSETQTDLDSYVCVCVKSTVDLVCLLQLDRWCISLSSLVRFLVTVGSLAKECFQGALESWHGTHQPEFCSQLVPCLRGSDKECPLTVFQMGPETSNECHLVGIVLSVCVSTSVSVGIVLSVCVCLRLCQ